MSQYEAMQLMDRMKQWDPKLDVWPVQVRAGDGYIWAVTSSYLT